MDSIIFDLDGTIWDSIDTVLSAWNTVIRKNNQIKSELTRKDFEDTMGLQMNEIGRKLFPTLCYKERQQLVKDCCEVEHSFLEKNGGVLYQKCRECPKRAFSKIQTIHC
ncbi:HAD family hydrolase [Virgibacillus subterraneus]|uniref:HAD family hydrolase n=1 Tax=Virgibacillus subterraneus TaxID=621109 RepID=UPI003183C433